MSLFKPQTLRCPACGQDNSFEVVGSINADRRPDLRDALLADSFQDVTCSRCATVFRPECEFNYLDAGRRQWIAALPARAMVDHLEMEEQALADFDKSYGSGAVAAARELGSTLEMRVTFGWPALREKLLLRQLGLDDVAMECMKMDLLRRLPDAPLAPGVELRVVALDGSTLVLTWVRALTEEVLEEVRLERALYDAAAGNAAGWADIRDELTRGPFVDMQRLFMGAGRNGSVGPQAATAAASAATQQRH